MARSSIRFYSLLLLTGFLSSDANAGPSDLGSPCSGDCLVDLVPLKDGQLLALRSDDSGTTAFHVNGHDLRPLGSGVRIGKLGHPALNRGGWNVGRPRALVTTEGDVRGRCRDAA